MGGLGLLLNSTEEPGFAAGAFSFCETSFVTILFVDRMVILQELYDYYPFSVTLAMLFPLALVHFSGLAAKNCGALGASRFHIVVACGKSPVSGRRGDTFHSSHKSFPALLHEPEAEDTPSGT